MITKTYKYKLQGDGRDSWEVSEWEGKELTNRYMVYIDPTKPKSKFSDEEILLIFEKFKELKLIQT